MSKEQGRPSASGDKRRRFLVQGASALTVLAAGTAGCQQQQKVSKAQAAYQSRPNGPQSCGNCANFIAPIGCRVVEGPVSADGWSRYWRARAA